MATKTEETNIAVQLRQSTATRLFSLDVFRGATIAAMILVNNPGNESAYAPLDHSKWNGWTPTDLIFPSFLFIVGVSLVLSFHARIAKGGSKRALLVHSLRRSILIFLIGLFLNGFPYFHLATWRVAGVLQRIALCYLAAAVIVLYLGSRAIWMWTGALLIGYWIAMRFIPVPGIGIPTVDMPINDPNANIGWYIDKLYLPGRMYEKVRDPEGILSTFPAIATTLLGVLTGQWLGKNIEAKKKFLGMLAFGVAAIVAGEVWNLWFPINKKLWTSSFVLFTAGCALLALSICYWICDVKLHRGAWTKPWVVFGTNAIAAYTLASLVESLSVKIHVRVGRQTFTIQEYLYSKLFGFISPPALGSLIYSIAFVIMCWLPMYVMYRKRIFLKV
jgi:predicted acyltransferase